MTPDQVRAEAEMLLVEIRELLTAGDAPGGFRQHYDAVLQADPRDRADASRGHERVASLRSHHHALVSLAPRARQLCRD